jgi:hypothetical protein
VADRPILNHAEMVYRPGDREAAKAFFETMGFMVSEIPNFPWLVITVDPAEGWGTDNVMYAQESTPAQQNFEAAFAEALANDSDLADKLERYVNIRRAHPQYVFHFGASVPTHEDWQQRVDALREANESHPLLKGRIDMDTYEPGVPGALGPLSQAFIYSDIIAVGPIQASRLLFDLQWAPEIDFENMVPIEFPDRSAMV